MCYWEKKRTNNKHAAPEDRPKKVVCNTGIDDVRVCSLYLNIVQCNRNALCFLFALRDDVVDFFRHMLSFDSRKDDSLDGSHFFYVYCNGGAHVRHYRYGMEGMDLQFC